jgi:8-oxo-dGTP diphosphatase
MLMAAIATPDGKTEVVVARALVESDGRVLLLRRAPWDSMPGHWELPGGKVDPEEPLLDGLAREIEEETGLTLDAPSRLSSTRRFRSPSGWRVHECVYETSGTGPVRLSDEHDAFAWVVSPGLRRLTHAAAVALAARHHRVRALAA